MDQPIQELQLVRQPIALKASVRRTLVERFGLRFPAASALVVRLAWRLSPRSRARQEFVGHLVRLGLEAFNRGDLDAAFGLYHPDVETVTAPQLVSVGFDPMYRGRPARIHFQQRWSEDWGEFQFRPEELFDLGDRLLVLGRIRGSGLRSGAGIDSEWGVLLTVSAGQVIRDEYFFERSAALTAAGLPA